MIKCLDTPVIARLQRWLEANRRSTNTFRLATETLGHLDAAMQKACGFWPQLAAKIVETDDGDIDEKTCITRLVWKDRKRVNELFRDPNSFEPNINYM